MTAKAVTCNQKSPISGFTLLELSIVLTVLSLFIGGIMMLMTQNIRLGKQGAIQAKMDTIESALETFRERNNRLPCPADVNTIESNQYFGMEEATPGTCAPYASGGNFTDGINTVIGVIPVRALGLPDDAMFDPWGGRFTYMVDMRMTATTPAAFVTYNAQSTVGSITVYDASGTNPRVTDAIAVLISHGPNGHGAFQLSGVRKSSGSDNHNELINCHCNSDGSNATASATAVQQPYSSSAGDIYGEFDDTVRYYTRSNFLTASEFLSEIP